MKNNQNRLFLFLSFFCLCVWPDSAAANEKDGITSQLKAGIGFEYLKYDERLPEFSLESTAELSNIIAMAEGLKRWENVFIGIRGMVPLLGFDSREEWFKDAVAEQSNSLEYGTAQFAAFIGYPLALIFNPFLGVRSMWSRQERFNFTGPGGSIPSYTKVTEEVTAHFVSLGFQGGLPVSEKWQAAYGFEYNLPYYSKITNDGLPGWKATNINGYMWSCFGELIYYFRDALSFSLFLGAGKQHWNGGDRQLYDRKQVIWPENTTYSIRSFLKMNWDF